jgi:predicted Zn-dependent peptidase
MRTLVASHIVGSLAGDLTEIAAQSADLYLTRGVRKEIISARLFWDGGPVREPVRQAGLHAITMAAVLRTEDDSTGQILADELESAGVSAEWGVRDSACHLELRAPREYLRRALPVMLDRLTTIAISGREVAAATAIVRHELDRRRQDVRSVAVDALRSSRFRAGSRLAAPPAGTAEGVEAVTAQDVVAAGVRLVWGTRLRVLIAGDDDTAAYGACIGRGRAVAAEPAYAAPWASLDDLAASPEAEVVSDWDLSDQAHLLWGVVTQLEDAADFAALEVAMHILGGWAGSRWHALFRERLGYSYGTHAAVQKIGLGEHLLGMGYAGLSVAMGALPHALDLIRAESAALPESLLPAELATACTQLLRSEALVRDSARGLIASAADCLQGGLRPSFAADRIAVLRGADVRDIASRLPRLLSEPTLVIVGPQTSIGDCSQ